MTYLDLFREAGYRVYVKHLRYYPYFLSPLSEKEAKTAFYSLSECESRGGLTEVEVYKDNEFVSSGTALCSEQDNYCKMYGRELALERALNTLLQKAVIVRKS